MVGNKSFFILIILFLTTTFSYGQRRWFFAEQNDYLNPENTVSISSFIDNELIAGWEFNSDNISPSTDGNLVSFPASMGTEAGNSNFDIVTAAGTPYVSYSLGSDKAVIALSNESIHMNGTGTFGDTITYVTITKDLDGNRDFLIGQRTASDATTGIYFDHSAGGDIWTYFNDDIKTTQADNLIDQDSLLVTCFGYSGTKARHTVVKIDGGGPFVESSVTHISSGQVDHGTSTTLNRIMIGGRDTGGGDVGLWNFYKYLFLFKGEISQNECITLATEIANQKILIE